MRFTGFDRLLHLADLCAHSRVVSPDPYLLGAEKSGVKPEKCIVL